MIKFFREIRQRLLTENEFSKYLTYTVLMLVLLTACQTKKKNETTKKQEHIIEKLQSYGNDISFLKKHMEIIELTYGSNQAKVAISQALQGRVMTSTSQGSEGQSFGWLNYGLIESGEVKEHFNPIGGEERFWLGPEGGQYSIFFKPGTTFEFDNWYVPKQLDTEPFDLVSITNSQVQFKKQMRLLNHSGNTFNILVDRTIRLLDKQKATSILGIEFTDDISMVGFETENSITNNGDKSWDKTSGMLSIWILSMLKPSDETTVIIPFKPGDEKELAKIVTDYRFGKGKISPNRLTVLDSVILFKADGKERGKIGVSPKRALPLAGSYDAKNKVLTIASFSLPEGKTDYVNSLWEIQKTPFAGDAVNSYNDGPIENENQLGPFYELESSSPATELSPNEKMTHIHRTFHLVGNKASLDLIAQKLFGLRLDEINM